MAEENVDVVEISNLYVIGPTGPERVALVTRSAGRGGVVAPFSGAMGTGASMVMAGPTVSL